MRKPSPNTSKLHGVREHAVTRGFAAVKGWLKSLMKGQPANPSVK